MPCPDKDTNSVVSLAEISLSRHSTDLIDEANTQRLESPSCSNPSANSRLNVFVICELSSPNRKVTPFFFTVINPFLSDMARKPIRRFPFRQNYNVMFGMLAFIQHDRIRQLSKYAEYCWLPSLCEFCFVFRVRKLGEKIFNKFRRIYIDHNCNIYDNDKPLYPAHNIKLPFDL